MFLKKVIPCALVALASASMSGCVMAEGGYHRGPSSEWHHHHASYQDQQNDNGWSHHAGPAASENNASQHLGPPPATDSAAQHLGPPTASDDSTEHRGPATDSGIHRWQPSDSAE